MAFKPVKKGTKQRPRDPRNQHNAHPNPGGGGPPSDPSPLQAQGGSTNRGVLSAAAASLAAGGGMSVLAAPWLQLLFLLLPLPFLLLFLLHPRGRILALLSI